MQIYGLNNRIHTNATYVLLEISKIAEWKGDSHYQPAPTKLVLRR